MPFRGPSQSTFLSGLFSQYLERVNLEGVEEAPPYHKYNQFNIIFLQNGASFGGLDHEILTVRKLQLSFGLRTQERSVSDSIGSYHNFGIVLV